MRMVRRMSPVMVIAALLVAAASIVVAERPVGPVGDPSGATHTERDTGGTFSLADMTDSAVSAALAAARTAEPRSAPLWALPGLAAPLAALCLMRLLGRGPTAPARRMLLRGSPSNRAPPIGSFV